MAKDITEIINAAAVVRDETGEAANTAARVGGSIADVAQYIQEEIITPLLAAQSQAVSAERIAEYAKKIAEEAAQKISTAIADKDYCLRNIYFLQEGIGCAAFDYAMSLGDVPVQSEEVTRQDGDIIILDTSANRFVLERRGKFYTKFLSNGASLRGWDVYANIRHTFLNRQDKSYWYRKEDGTLTQGSSTFVIGKWLKELQGYADFSETEITQHASRITGLEAKVKELGAFDTFAALFAQAAKFDIVSNNAIALLHGTYKQADGIYHGVLIFQQVEVNNDGGGTAMQYIYIEKRKYTRYIYFSQTAVTAVQGVQNDGARNLSLSGRALQMKDMWGNNVGSGATIPDNGNLYEGTAGASSVPITLAKTFGGTATATLGAATSARAGVMTVSHVNRISKLEGRVLQYLYPKIYQLNEGAGARVFNGFYTGSASVSAERKTASEEGFSYKVVFKLGSFYLQEISPGGVTECLYSSWDKIGDIASSESYAQRDCLYYIYVAGEGSTYYYIDSNGEATEKSATYLLRRLVDKNVSEITKLKTITENSQNKLNKYSDTFPQNPVASLESNGLMSAADKAKVGNYPEQFVLDLGILNSQSEGENIAAASEVAGNRNISFIRFKVQGVSELKTTLIMQWPNGINETAQIMCVDKAQWRRNVTGATGVKGATTNAFKWERTAPHSIDYDEQRRMIQLKDYENKTVSQEVELPLATSSQHGLMSIADKEKISDMESELSALEARVAALENK